MTQPIFHHKVKMLAEFSFLEPATVENRAQMYGGPPLLPYPQNCKCIFNCRIIEYTDKIEDEQRSHCSIFGTTVTLVTAFFNN